MRNFSLNLAILTITAFYLCVGVAAPAQPRISVTNESGYNYNGKRVVARYGIADDVYRQSQLAVKQLSFLIKKYPDAKSWAVAYNTESYYWRVLEYNIGRRQLVEIKSDGGGTGKSWGYDYFPAHIHRAAQASMTIEELWKLNDDVKSASSN